MGIDFPSCKIFIWILISIALIQGRYARKLSKDAYILQKHEINDDGNEEAKHVSEGMDMDHIEPSLNVFFTLNDLKVGKTMPIYFSERNITKSPRLLTKEEADSIPFSLSKLSNLLEFFSFTKESSQAKAMEYTLEQCEIEPFKGETKFCATSLETMLDSASRLFGLNNDFEVLTTTHLTKSSTLLQNYTIWQIPKEIFAPKMIACHTMPFPYAVFYCHGQETGNRLFEISLDGENGERVQAIAVCHMDTSQWDRDHVSFRVLRIEPGSSPVCHFFPSDNLVWVPLRGQQ